MADGRLPDPGGVTQLPGALGTTGRMALPGNAGRLAAPAEPAVNPTPWGFLGNVVKGVGSMVKGISDLVGMGVHDIVGGVEHLIPGQQSVEAEGSQLLKVAQVALPGSWVPGPDLGGQYGAIASDYAQRYGSVGKFLEGFYKDPISYVADALIVADGVGLAAKAGQGAGLLSHLPALMPASTAAKILGPAAELDEAGNIARIAKYGTETVGSLEVPGGEALKLSTNFLKRAVQRKVYGAITVAPEELLAAARTADMTAPAAGSLARAEEMVAASQAAGIQMLRPGVSGFLAKHGTSRILSTIRVRRNMLSQEAVGELDAIYNVRGEDGKLIDPETVGAYKQGLATPIEMPDNAPFEVQSELPRLDPVSMPQATVPPARTPEGFAELKTLSDNFEAVPAPHMPGAVDGADRYSIPVASMDDADRVGREAAAAAGLTPIGVADSFADATNPHGAFRMMAARPDGSLVELNLGTPDILQAQSAAGRVLKDLEATHAKLTAEVEKLAKLPEDAPETAAIATNIDLLKTEAQAAREWMDGLFDDARASFHAEHGGAAYDPTLRAAYRSRVWDQNHVISRWMNTGRGSYTTLMERAYGPQRIFQLQAKLEELTGVYRTALEHAYPMGTPQEAAAEIYNILHAQGIPDPLIDHILAKFPGKFDTETATRLLARRTRDALWDYAVAEGGHGAAFGEGFADFDWRVMHGARKASGMPTASYMPHFADQVPSDFMRAGRRTGLGGPGTPGIAKNWSGALFERGFVNMNAHDAAERAARIMINHQEVQDLVDQMAARYARKLSPEEVDEAMLHGNPRYSGERFFSPKQIRDDLEMRSKYMTDSMLGGISTGSLTEGTVQATESLSEGMFARGLDQLDKGNVYAIPRKVADMLEHESSLQFGKAMKMFWDTPMGVWKKTVLSLSPRWLINNFFGNLVFMGLENPGALRFSLSQMESKNQRLMRAVLGNEYVGEVESGFYKDASKLGPEFESMASRVGGKLQKYPNAIQHMQSAIEESARRGVLLNALQRGELRNWAQGFHSSNAILKRLYTDGFDPAIMDDALKSVDRTLGNYMRYSPIEQNVIRRFISPFYGFYRHSVNVLVRLPIEHPLKARVLQEINAFSQQFQETMPEYMRDQAAVSLGIFGGKDIVARFASMNPLSAFAPSTGGVGPLIGLLNPAAKVVLERQLGIDSFTGDPFATPDDMVQTHDGSYFQVLRDGAGNVVGVERTGRPLPNLLSHIGGQFGVVNMIPYFSRYPKSFGLSLASYAGLPLSSPKTSLDSSLAFEQDMEKQALSEATGTGGDPFASFPSLPSFPSIGA